jgi:hypothetical protein
MTDREWLDALATALGVAAPTQEEHEAILQLAAVAAHSSERTAAPSSAWLAARSGRPVADVLATARTLAERP